MKRKILIATALVGLAVLTSGIYSRTESGKRLFANLPNLLHQEGTDGILPQDSSYAPVSASGVGLVPGALFALAGMAAPFVLLFAGFAAAQSIPGYSLIRDSISSLAWAPAGWTQTIGFLIVGLLFQGFTAGLSLSVRGRGSFGLGVFFLACCGFGLLLLGAFRTDNGLPTVDGAIHGFVANTVFILIPIASLLIAPSLRNNAHWRPLFRLSLATGIFAVVLIGVYRLWLNQFPWFGLYERILTMVEVFWIELMAARLLRLCLRKRMAPMAPDSPASQPG